MVNGLGSGREATLTGLAFVPVAVAAVPAQPAARTARPARAAATARRVVVLAMVPPVCRRSPRTVRPRKAGGIGAATRAGLWPARIFPAAAVPQSGHGTRGAVRGHPGTAGLTWPLGRSGACRSRAGRSRRCRRGTGRGSGAGPGHHVRGKLGRRDRADRVRWAGPDRRGPGGPPGPAAWQDGQPLIPSIAMVAAGFTFPLLVHLILSHPTGRAGTPPARLLVTAVYAEAVLTGSAMALFRNPYLDLGCLANCNVNVFLVRSLPSLARAVEVADRWFTAFAATALILVCAARLVKASWPARQRLLPVHLPAIGFAAAVVARAAELQKTTVEDPFNTALFTIFAIGSAAVILLAAGLISGVGRARAERRAVARIAASLDQAPAPGSLQSAMAAALHDPG